MRTGPFSNTNVIERLNSLYIPVYAVNEDYRELGVAHDEEKAEYLAIYREALEKGFSTGTVHVYVLNPRGQVIGTRHVADAAKTTELIPFLDSITAQLKVTPGPTLIEPKPQSCPPACPDNSLVLHLVARPLGGGGSWDGTAEDWVVYEPDEVKSLIGDFKHIGDRFEPPAELAARLLTHVYPVTENNDISKNEILEQQFRLTLISRSATSAIARIDGRLVMRHDFYHQPDGKTVETDLVGYMEWDVLSGHVQRFRLVTDDAKYGGGEFAVVARSE